MPVFPLKLPRLAVLLSLLLLLFPASPQAQVRDPKLVELAGRLSAALNKKLHLAQNKRPFSYLVYDFGDSSADFTQLDIQLAHEFSSAMEKESEWLQPIERDKLTDLSESERLPRAALQSGESARWVAETLGADLLILGAVERGKDGLTLRLRVEGEKHKQIVTESAQLAWTEERTAWAKAPVADLEPVKAWPDIPTVGKGYAEPKCVYCPVPSFTPAARKARITGVVTVRILIGEDGSVKQSVALTGLPAGLTGQALAATRTWRFKPILGPDGKPATVQVPIEIAFKLI